MKKSFCDKMKTAKGILFAAVGVLVAVVLILSAVSRNTVNEIRSDGEYAPIENAVFTNIGDETNVINECRFTLKKAEHCETLAFFVNHNEVEVYVADECVYTLTANQNGVFATVGGIWVMVPLYADDVGKEIRVVLTPTYDDYNEPPELLLGSEIAIHNVALHRALPAVMLSMCVVFTGFLLVCLGAYRSIKGVSMNRLYTLGLMAISAGIWRITYDRVAYFLLENNSALVYTVSIISLMLMALSMLNSLEANEKSVKFIRICSCCYSVAYIAELFLQIADIADLRQTLKVIHATIIISAAAFVVDGIARLFKSGRKKGEKINFTWLLGIGAVADLMMYYFADSSSKIVFTLVAILCYSSLEGIGLMFTYIEQKNTLEEMKTQLTLSRAAIMMSRIRSHFVFNVLNAISGMCKYDPQMADDTVVRFARYLRSNIDIMEKDGNIPFVTDLRQLKDYVALE